MAVEFRVLGPVDVRIDNRPISVGYAKQRCVLAALLLESGRIVTVDRMVHRLWGEEAPVSARNVLYGHVARLRRALREAGVLDVGAMLASRCGGYQLAVDPESLDLYQFRRLTREARGAPDNVAVSLLRQALDLWLGPALAGTDGPWSERARTALDGERLAAQLELHDRLLKQGANAMLIAELSELVARYPLHEGAMRRLMLAFYRSGLTAEALACYTLARRRLVEALGADPGPELDLLHRQMLRRDPALLAV